MASRSEQSKSYLSDQDDPKKDYADPEDFCGICLNKRCRTVQYISLQKTVCSVIRNTLLVGNGENIKKQNKNNLSISIFREPLRSTQLLYLY